MSVAQKSVQDISGEIETKTAEKSGVDQEISALKSDLSKVPSDDEDAIRQIEEQIDNKELSSKSINKELDALSVKKFDAEKVAHKTIMGLEVMTKREQELAYRGESLKADLAEVNNEFNTLKSESDKLQELLENGKNPEFTEEDRTALDNISNMLNDLSDVMSDLQE